MGFDKSGSNNVLTDEGNCDNKPMRKNKKYLFVKGWKKTRGNSVKAGCEISGAISIGASTERANSMTG